MGRGARFRTFGPPITSGGGPVDPIGVTVGDLNGDGVPDIILAHLIPHGFAVYLGHGDGSFGDPVFYGTSNAPAAKCAVGDVNGDGKLDVVAATGTKVLVYVGNGTGSLTWAISLFESVIGIHAVGVADFNGDTKLDLVAAKVGVDVWLGNGDATFGPLTHYAGPGALAYSMAIADFNGDGFQDCAVANPGASIRVSIFHGKGDGSFVGRADFTTLNGPVQVASGDFDEDGRPDLAVACSGGNAVSVFLNRTTVVDAPQSGSRAFLAQSEPNPASDAATIRFSLQQAGPASLRIYDVSGRAVATLFHGQAAAGWHTARWDRSADRALAPAGVYFYELRTNEGRLTKRMTVLQR